MNLPAAFLDRLARIVPADRFDAVIASFSTDKPVALRVNTLKAESSAVAAELAAAGFALQPSGLSPLAWIVPFEAKRALTETEAFYAGRIYLQNLSSQLAPIVLGPEAGETVLDLAAAPGGKTSQMAAMMRGEGRLSAVEPVRDRFFRLKANLEQQGAGFVKCYLTDGRSVGGKCPEMFDRVLLDAPCSSEARFDPRDPASFEHWSPRKVSDCAHKQKRLLQSAWAALKPGGRLLYSTCSFAPEENEGAVAALLKQVGEQASVLPIGLDLPNRQPTLAEWDGKRYPDALAHAVRVLPDAVMDGFFLCLLEKRGA
ncbi:RsmB/NOP family class I SAM-dependent RNA methyltransferase [Chitinimonas koreensis]|uniref:RsmB/NOP family class I SAM-dependent RNA methyltransferase n=1 Tax=Chitinimonas koreensis TaxID=356302 RepID=UPI0003F69C92|nr:RsmB/NOP family class I SAM-dependent RNA methyltransferase [Chitinimonas koreensis]QNM97580.1 RsmB/NOP family class I SAM-dependent RNA methyltransferase [Chitinimonas koreensis]